MYCKLSTAEKNWKRTVFKRNSIYCILYAPLWRQRGNDLSPEEVWIEGNNLALEFKQFNQADCDIRVREAIDDLCERYGSFKIESGEIINRSCQQAEHSAMMVSLVTFLLLLNVYPEAENHPYGEICKAIGDAICDIDGFKELYEGTRQEEDSRESQGRFIEVADFIEHIAIQKEPLSEKQLESTRHLLGQFIEENKYCSYQTMLDNERMLSRVNDNNGYCLQSELNLLRKQINDVRGNGGQNVEYKNIIFAKIYEDRVSEIRQVIYPFITTGTNHINTNQQRQWLAIIEPLKKIDGLLIEHDDRPRRKDCTDGEICQQMSEFFGKELPSVEFDKIPKSLTEERKKWKESGVGLCFADWQSYIRNPRSEIKYLSLAKVAERLYGEIIRVIRR